MRQIKAALFIDAKDVRDSCATRESNALGMMMGKRAAIEALALRPDLRLSGTEPRWIHKSSNDCGGAHQVFKHRVATVGKVSANVVLETHGRSWVRVVQKPNETSLISMMWQMLLQESRCKLLV